VSVLIDARKVTVVRLRLDDAGKPYMAGEELATETVVIAIDYPAKKVAS
jgi:hypothetical protein